MMAELIPVLLSLGVIASLLLIGFGGYALVKRVGDVKRSVLMIIAGLVTIVNIWLWATLPTPG
jgi:hypothetical protein